MKNAIFSTFSRGEGVDWPAIVTAVACETDFSGGLFGTTPPLHEPVLLIQPTILQSKSKLLQYIARNTRVVNPNRIFTVTANK